MTIKKMMMAAGAVAGEPQVIALSSNDWHYFGVMTAAGNTLGDHTVGGSVGAVQNQEALSSLHTFEGDFVIAFDLTKRSHLAFGVHAIDEDDTRANNDHCGMYSMTNSFWWGIDYSSGAQAKISSGDDGGVTAPAEGSSMVIRRESGTITLEDDGSVIHTYSSTYSGVMRFAVANAASPYDAKINNLFFTDTDKVQRDGSYNNTTNSGDYFGDGRSNARNFGQAIKITRTGKVTGVKFLVQTASTTFNCHCEVWGDDGTNPTSQVGSDSATLSLASTGVKTLTFPTPVPVNKGTIYWFVLVDSSAGSGDSIIHQITRVAGGFGTGRSGGHDTITSISGDQSRDLKLDVQVDTSDGEPTPDHNTLLLIHSNTTDGSTTFVDSSPFNRTGDITVVGTAQHDTAQNTLSQSSAMLFDGNSDLIHVPQSTDFEMTGAFTIEVVARFVALGTQEGLISSSISGAAYGTLGYNMNKQTSNKIAAEVSNGSGGPQLISSTALSVDTWYHIAVVRLPSNRVDLYINGTSEANSTLTGTLNNPSVTKLGAKNSNADGSSPGAFLNGWIQEARVSNVARWDADFTSPTSAYP